MKIALLVLGLNFVAAFASSGIVPIVGERIAADAVYLKRQKQVLDLYIGIANNEYFHNEYSDYDIGAHLDQYSNPSVVTYFLDQYKQGVLPVNGVFSLSNPYIRNYTISLFDVFYFANNFDAFYRAASWARKHVNPVQFVYAYSLALTHRQDSYNFVIPPFYEILPSYFVPQEVIHQIYYSRLNGLKEGSYVYNNTGYQYNYYNLTYGGVYGPHYYAPHYDYKVSYLTEDVGLNNYYAWWNLLYPIWLNPAKYGISNWISTGDSYYYTHQQIYARYIQERLANGLPFVQPLYWNQPIQTGYSPSIAHVNGQHFYVRGDYVVPNTQNQYYVNQAQTYQNRIYEAVDQGGVWSNTTYIPFNNANGVDLLGNIIYGSYVAPNCNYYGGYHYAALNALGYITNVANGQSYPGGVTAYHITALRDPVFYNYLNNVVSIVQTYKNYLGQYTQQDLIFPGVTVQDIEVDKLVTYYERYNYEVTNVLPVNNYNEYANLKYYASQYRLNHKPYTYKVTVNSNGNYEGIVRVYLGPKYDSLGNVLTIEQSRSLFVEIDRFPVHISSGSNVYVRNSWESPIYTNEYEGFRQLYTKINSAIKSQQPYYVNQRLTCGVPANLQLPVGWRNGLPYTVYVVVSPYTQRYNGATANFHAACGSPQLYDYRPYGYPFDRPINSYVLSGVSNIYYEDVQIYHRGEYVNYPEQQHV